MSKILFLLFTAFVLSFDVLSQYAGDIPAVNPLTPNEAAMFKPVAQPIGSFSGTVPIEIPLFTVGRPECPIPVTLNYNSSGFKVEEYASSVGLGWSLNAGGSITRVLHGLADDVSSSGYITTPSAKPSQILNYSTYSELEPPLNAVRIGALDLQPDDFYFTCNGISGKFHFDENGRIQIANPDGIIISVLRNGYQNQISGWILTDTKGYKYYFGSGVHTGATAVDRNSMSYSSNNGYGNLPAGQIYNTDWHLIEIDDINGFVQAFFNYSGNSNVISTRLQAYMKMQTGPTLGCEAGQTFNGDETFASSQIYESVLTSIVTPTEKINFYGGYTRVDYIGGFKVDSIKQTDLAGNRKKIFHFNYDYFRQSYIPPGGDGLYKRLELINIAEFGATGNDSLTHRFDYYTTYNLPSRNSRGQDYWGYYNGQDNNWTLLPNGSYTFMGVTVSKGTLGERRPIFPYSQANMLTKIRFPTGGSRTFTYEPNQYLWDPTSTAMPDDSFYVYRSLYADTWITFPLTVPQYQSTFTINSQLGGAVWEFYIDGCCFYGSYTVKILNQAGTTTLMTFGNQLSGSTSLQNGTYKVQFFFTGSTIYSFNAYWTELSMNTANLVRFGRTLKKNNMTGPGVRIKQVDDYDPVSGQTITTRYQYNLFSDSTLTSGLLITPTCVAIDMSCMDCEYIRLAANSNYPLSQQGGSYINYTDVRIYQTGNGRIDQRYSFDFDNSQGGDYDEFLSMLLDNSWRRGKLLSARYYDNNGTLLRMDTTCYSIVGDNSTFDLYPYYYPDTSRSSNFSQTFSLGFNVHAWIDPVNGQLDYDYRPWGLTSQYMQPDSIISRIYTSSGTQVEKTAYTYYDSLKYPLLQQEIRYLNNNTQLLKNYRYAFNKGNTFLRGLSTADLYMKDTLFGFNYLQPLEVVSQKQQGSTISFVEGSHISFGSFYVYPRVYRYPIRSRHYTSFSDSIDLNYVSYDSLGNLAEQFKTGDLHTVWLWGYNRTLPVAKVTGSNFSTVLGLVNNGVIQNPSSDQALRAEIDKIRNGLGSSKAQVTTYTWLPPFGMSSQEDPTGLITFYEYDPHGRLIVIRDQNNNIIKKIFYQLNNP